MVTAAEVWGNTGAEYIVAVISFVLILLAFKLFHHTVLWRLEAMSEKTENDLDDLFIDIVKTIRWWFYIVASLWIAQTMLAVGTVMSRIADAVLIISLVYQVVKAAGLVVDYAVRKKIDGRPDGQSDAIIDLLTKISKFILWVIGFLFVLQNLGIDVTSLIAGLGIGGVAIALALQNILSDLFSSFSIYFDKPFEVGDFIAIGDLMGTVEDIGIKTTRLRSLSGEEIVLANRELTTARIQNYKDTQRWRGTFSVGVTYDTAPETLDEVKQLIQEIADGIETITFERANATKFGDSAINFDVSFYSETGDYTEHMSYMHQLHSRILEAFNERDISIAFPTRTVYMHNQ